MLLTSHFFAKKKKPFANADTYLFADFMGYLKSVGQVKRKPTVNQDALSITFFSTQKKPSADTDIYLFADFMGYLKSVGQVKRKPTSNQDETIYRKVDIESLRYATFQP